MPKFVIAGDNLINVDKLLYVTKCKNKPLFIAQFESSDINMAQFDNMNYKLFLEPKEYKEFLDNLAL